MIMASKKDCWVSSYRRHRFAAVDRQLRAFSACLRGLPPFAAGIVKRSDSRLQRFSLLVLLHRHDWFALFCVLINNGSCFRGTWGCREMLDVG